MAFVHHDLHPVDRAAKLALRAALAIAPKPVPGPKSRPGFDAMISRTPAPDAAAFEMGEVGGVAGWRLPQGADPLAAILYLHGASACTGARSCSDPQWRSGILWARSRFMRAPRPSLRTMRWRRNARSRRYFPMQIRPAADPLLSRDALAEAVRLYLNGCDPHDPQASALDGDFGGMAPVRIHAGDAEVLLGDAVRFAECAEGMVRLCDVYVWDGMVHVFPANLLLHAARAALDDVGVFLRDRLREGTVS